MAEIKKTITEKKMLKKLQKGDISLPPLFFPPLKNNSKIEKNIDIDVCIEVFWGKKFGKFAVEIRSLSTPKTFREGINKLITMQLPDGYLPMLCLPYLNEQQLHILEQKGISGIDFSGNGVVIVPGIFSVFRNGQENRFKSSALIKNVYRKNSSMVGRLFLISPKHGSVQNICAEIGKQNFLVLQGNKKSMNISTVSKVLKILEDDLIIERGDNIQLIQPEKLLSKLSENYSPRYNREPIHMKIEGNSEMIKKILWEKSQELKLPVVATGFSSVMKYATMQQDDIFSVFCPHIDELQKILPGSITDRFPNIELIETEDEALYFNAQLDNFFRWASPVQVYLELMTGDKRDQEIAEQIKSYIIKQIEG